MIVDLVSPWSAAVEAENRQAMADFRRQHASLLERLRQTHTPHLDLFPLQTDPVRLRALRDIATTAALHEQLAATLAAAVALAGTNTVRVLLLPAEQWLDPLTALPRPEPLSVLPLDGDTRDAIPFSVHLARDVALIARWRASDSASDSASAIAGMAGLWDPWETGRRVPLREWIYAHGVAWHLAQQLHPRLPPHELFGVNGSAWQRLREREGACRALLLADLDRHGMAALLHWLPADGWSGPRGTGEAPLPPRMGHYLAWRLTAPRVARAGIGAALRDTA